LALAQLMTEPHLPVPAADPEPSAPVRTCIVTGVERAPEEMVRFVVGPEGNVVPDLARQLPGRGIWVTALRSAVEQAVTRKLFSKAARAAVLADADLPERVERLLLERVLSDLSRARRAGRAVAGFVRVEQMMGHGRAGLLIVAAEADGDGLAKLTKTGLPLERLGTKEILGGVFGRDQAVYVAVARDDASGQFIQRIAGGSARWRGYRFNSAG
jgi:predicted RNA-binding protein YlxR (DUF448 family)